VATGATKAGRFAIGIRGGSGVRIAVRFTRGGPEGATSLVDEYLARPTGFTVKWAVNSAEMNTEWITTLKTSG
jgi:hypothetical protein